MPKSKFNIKDLKSNDTVQFQASRDWVTISRLNDATLMVSRQGQGSYSCGEVSEDEANCLIGEASSDLL